VKARVQKIRGLDSLLGVSFWEEVFGQLVKKVGPNWTGFACEQDFKPSLRHPTRPVMLSDLAALETLSEVCPESELDPSDFKNPAFPVCGCEVGGELVAVAAVANSRGRMANLQVAVLPAFRRKGFASAAISGLAVSLFADDYVLGYSTWADNLPSCSLAQGLGFWHHDISWDFIPTEVWSGQQSVPRDA